MTASKSLESGVAIRVRQLRKSFGSQVVLDGIEPTVDVLHQLNDVNAGLVGARVWLCDNVVVAGVDVPCSSISEIGGVIRQLDVQIDGLDVFLSALGAEAA